MYIYLTTDSQNFHSNCVCVCVSMPVPYMCVCIYMLMNLCTMWINYLCIILDSERFNEV